MTEFRERRRRYTALSALAALVLIGCGSGPEAPRESEQPARAPSLPSEPVTLNVLDVGGVLNFTRPQIEEYVRTHRDVVREVNFTQAPSTELVSRLKAQQNAGRVDTDLVLSGSDAISAGVEQEVYLRILPNYEEALAGATRNYTDVARQTLELAQGHAAVVATELTGPLMLYDPDGVRDVPTTPQELLAWAREHPDKFAYARPPSSGPGRQFLMGLPYLLGDSDPRDPVDGWDKTWAFLEDLDAAAAPYPSSTDQLNRSLANGTREIIISTAGWDLATRQQRVMPRNIEAQPFADLRWIAAGHYMAVPRGVEDSKLAVALDVIEYLLQPPQQVALFAAQEKPLPGPAIEGVTLEQAPADVRRAIERIWRPEYDVLNQDPPTAPELGSAALSRAFDRWEREIGA